MAIRNQHKLRSYRSARVGLRLKVLCGSGHREGAKQRQQEQGEKFQLTLPQSFRANGSSDAISCTRNRNSAFIIAKRNAVDNPTSSAPEMASTVPKTLQLSGKRTSP